MQQIYLFIFLIIGLTLAIVSSIGKSRKVKYIVWGLVTALVIAPSVSIMIGHLYAGYEAEGFAGVAMIMIMFPLIFLIGIVILLIGIF